jgi:hypothetical protein
MLEQATFTVRAAMPRVNLLPPEIEEHRRFAQLRLVLAGVVVLTATGLGALYALADREGQDAAAQMQVERDRSSAIAQASARYGAVPQLEHETQAAERSLQTAMAQEVRWSYFLNDISSVMPADAWLTGMTMTQRLGAQTSAPGAPGPGTSGPGIASLTYAGVGNSYPAVAVWLEAQDAISTSDDPYVTTTADTKIGEVPMVSFETTATVNASAYSHRYTARLEARP